LRLFHPIVFVQSFYLEQILPNIREVHQTILHIFHQLALGFFISLRQVSEFPPLRGRPAVSTYPRWVRSLIILRTGKCVEQNVESLQRRDTRILNVIRHERGEDCRSSTECISVLRVTGVSIVASAKRARRHSSRVPLLHSED